MLIELHRIIFNIVKEVETNISKNTLLTNFRMRALPTLYQKFVELLGYLVSYTHLHDNVYSILLFFPFFSFV